MRNKFRLSGLLTILAALFFAGEVASAQNQKVAGTILDPAGNPVVGASVIVKGTTKGTTSDGKGRFEIPVSGKDILYVAFIGFESQDIPVGGKTELTIRLKEATTMIDEVVAIGYGSQKKISVTGALGTVKGSEVLKSPVSAVGNALMGRIPGVMSVQRSGEPGKDVADIYIRGTATFNSANTKPLVIVDGIERSMNEIDPNEIETINVLKDASSTAVYGVRGANGVIIVTTKTGQVGKPQVNFSANVALQNPTGLPELLDGYEYAMLHNEASENDDRQPTFDEVALKHLKLGDDPYFYPNVDHLDMLLRRASPQQQYNVNVRGGTQRVRYFVSLGMLDQQGMYKYGNSFSGLKTNPKYTRYNIRANVDLDWTKYFSTSVKLGTSMTDANYAGNNNDFVGTILSANPVSSPVMIGNKFIYQVDGAPIGQVSSPPMYVLTKDGYQNHFTSSLNVDISAVYKLDRLTKGLSVRGKVAYDNYYKHSVKKSKQIPLYNLNRLSTDPASPDYTTPVLTPHSYEGPVKFVSEGYGHNRKFYAEAALDYNRTFNGGHTVTALLLGNLQRYYNGANELPYNYLGLVGRVTYNYSNRYMLEFNIGYNGSENFAKGKRFGVFPAVSAGYVLTEEPFFPKNEVLTFLKLRGSYGLVGNDKSSYRFLYQPSSYSAQSNVYFFGENHAGVGGYTEKSLGNQDVTWETAAKMNLGIDLRFFNDALSVSGDYFTEKRDDILWSLNIPVTFGQPSLVAPYNIGQAENRGFELSATFNGHIGKRFTYWLNANYSFARNKVVYKDEIPKPYPGLTETGCRIGQPKGLIFEGFYNTWDEINDPNRPISEWEGAGLQPGDAKYRDVNGDHVINSNDRVSIGFPNVPEKVYAFSFGGSWKGLDFSVLFQGAANVSTYVMNEGMWSFVGDSKSGTTITRNRWTKERYEAGEPISYPRLQLNPNSAMHNYVYSTLWQQDASYLRLKNVEIGYTFTMPGLKKAGIQKLRVYASGQNLVTWTDVIYYDPEKAANGTGAGYPLMRVFNLGVSLQF